jgi:hypothetical protein
MVIGSMCPKVGELKVYEAEGTGCGSHSSPEIKNKIVYLPGGPWPIIMTREMP